MPDSAEIDMQTPKTPIDVLLVAVPETSGSALYDMLDVLMATGSIWQELVREQEQTRFFQVNIIGEKAEPFYCGNRVPVEPAFSFQEPFEKARYLSAQAADTTNAPLLIIIPELWLGPDESVNGRYPELVSWLQQAYRAGAFIFSACSGAILLAESGLLNGCAATSHWAYQDLFRRQYPKVRFDPGPSLVVADTQGHIVTSGGTTSWHDLALHIISRFAGIGEAMLIAKAYLLKRHEEGQLPYSKLIRSAPHADGTVRRCQDYLKQNFRQPEVLTQSISQSGIPERSLKRRFKQATGMSLIEYIQALRIDAAKALLEQGELPIEEISEEVGYSDLSFFRRLFKRLTGLRPGEYRRMFSNLPEVVHL